VKAQRATHGLATPTKVQHLADFPTMSSYRVELSDGRVYRVDQLHSNLRIRVRTIPRGRCVTLSENTKFLIRFEIRCLAVGR
jgi:hypothetical protein